MSSNEPIIYKKLSEPTKFGLQKWVLIVTSVAFLFTCLIITVITICLIRYRRRKSYNHRNSSMDRRLLSCNTSTMSNTGSNMKVPAEHGVVFSRLWSGRDSDMESVYGYSGRLVRGVSRRNNRFGSKEIEVATNGFCKESVVENSEFGVVYEGVLLDGTKVAVKSIASNCLLQDMDFITEVEAIGHVKHKNLVNLLGYCIDGTHRMLVYEYVENGNLYKWLHEYPGQVSPLTWSIRRNIIQGMAKGLAYLHEDVEPKLLHRSLKSSNILLDHQWNPKLTDFGVAKIFNPELNSMTMETLGYEDLEYDPTSGFSQKNDVYSFGIVIMEIISGKTPVDHHEQQPYLIEWLKSMVASEKAGDVVDPKMAEMKPCLKELKRMLLIALRCVDPDVQQRPQMGHVLHMLEPRDLLLIDDHRVRRATSRCSYAEEDLNSEELGESTQETI